MNSQEIISAWNAQADDHNQWCELGEDEKLEWAYKLALYIYPAPIKQPLTDTQIQAIHNTTGAGHSLICLVESYINDVYDMP